MKLVKYDLGTECLQISPPGDDVVSASFGNNITYYVL